MTLHANKEFYLPNKPVFREGAETTKLRVVYDMSAKPSRESPSLNKCLEKGPSLQNLLWKILVLNRFKPYVITADIQKAFLQIIIRESDRDALRFHWIKNQDINQIDILRFTRLAFGLTQSPFVLEATLGEHIAKYREVHKKIVEEVAASMYVEDLISGGCKKEEVIELKENVTKIFQEGGFTLHKWQTNCSIESYEKHHETIEHPFTDQITTKSQGRQTQTSDDVLATSGNIIPNVNREISYPGDTTFAKQQLGTKSTDTKILGIHWNENEDTLSVEIPKSKGKYTKRNILSHLASIYDPLGFISPVDLLGKIVC